MRKSFILILVLLSVVCFAFTAQADDPTAVRRVYTVTAPYLTTADEISFEELSSIWTDDIADETDGISNILVSEDELPALISIFGKEPGKRITVLSKNELYADPNLASAWMIVPFEDIEPRRKVITMDGNDILTNQFDPDTWPLTAVIGDVKEGAETQPVYMIEPDSLTVLLNWYTDENLETLKAIESSMLVRNYKGFLSD